MEANRVTFADRVASAVLSAIAGGITGTLVWVLFAMWLGRFFLSLENLHFVDTVKWFSIGPGVIGFVAPNLVLEFFGHLWKWMWEFVRGGGGIPPG